jgi:hypothetical protein
MPSGKPAWALDGERDSMDFRIKLFNPVKRADAARRIAT